MSIYSSTLAGVMAIIMFPATAIAQQIPSFAPGNHMWGWGGMWFLGPIMMLLFLGLAAAVIALVFRWVFGIGSSSDRYRDFDRYQDPLDILKERYAKGAIDKKEYEERKKVLKAQ